MLGETLDFSEYFAVRAVSKHFEVGCDFFLDVTRCFEHCASFVFCNFGRLALLTLLLTSKFTILHITEHEMRMKLWRRSSFKQQPISSQ